MATQTDSFGNPINFKPNSDAATVFGQNQTAFNANAVNYAGSPRPKYLFMVRFVRASGSGSSTWADGMTYAVKMFDRPKITPTVQELNQYNKKRLIQTGVKYAPVKISFYDTIDAAAQMMWYQYANFYFGDFRQTQTAGWLYDVTGPQFQGGENGFGFSPNLGSDAVSDVANTAYFFDHIECYQFYAGEYVQFDLVNPKIVSFDPDAFESEHSDAHSIEMSLEYESVIYHNQNTPASISSNPTLSAWFQKLNPAFDPFTVAGYTPGAGAPGNNLSSTSTGSSGGFFAGLVGLGATLMSPGGSGGIASAAKQLATGTIGALGTATFGQNNALSGAFSSALPGLMNGSLNGASVENSLLNGFARNPSGSLSALSNIGNNQIPASQYSQSLGLLGKFMGSGATTTTAQGLAAVTTTSAVNNGSAVSSTFSGSSLTGLSLSPDALATYNAYSPSSAQVGVFSSNTTSSSQFTIDPSSLI